MKKVVLLSPAHPLRGGIASSSERLAQEILRAVLISLTKIQQHDFRIGRQLL